MPTPLNQETPLTLGLVLAIVSPFVAILLALNAFFLGSIFRKVQGLIEAESGKIQTIANLEKAIKETGETSEKSIGALGGQLRGINQDIKDLKKIETEVAVLRTLFDMLGVKPKIKVPGLAHTGSEESQ